MKAPATQPEQRCCPSLCASTSERPVLGEGRRMARVFKALGDETRLSIVAMLGGAGCALCVCEIEPKFDLSQPTISHHLKVLRDAGVVETERRGTWVYYTLKQETMTLLREFWENLMSEPNVKETVRKRYGEAAQVAAKGRKASCCSPLGNTDPITRDLYGDLQLVDVPSEALLASLGCGNPTALAELHAGEVVLDLGSGGGIDVLLSARRVGPTGKAYGLDMTPEMLALARENQKKAGVDNVEFLAGSIEQIPLPDASVDVIISNCVINLSTDKDAVLREAFRVLKPGGRFAVSDIVLKRALPPEASKSMELWTGCVAGALVADDYAQKLRDAGFSQVDIEPTRVYSRDDASELLSSSCGCCCGGTTDVDLDAIDGAVMSAFVRAVKG